MTRKTSGFSRRSIMKGAGAAAFMLAAPSILTRRSFAQGTPELSTLRSTSKSWLWAAEDYASASGLFEEVGINVLSNASNRGTNVAALQGGAVDIVLGDPGEAMRARGQNLQIKTFVSMVNRYASHVVLKNAVLQERGLTESSPEAEKIEALRGLTIGTTGPGAAPDSLLRYLSSLGGFSAERDMQLVTIQGGGPGVLAALQQSAIQGFCLSSPTADLAVQREDCGYLFQMALRPPAALTEYQYIIASTAESAIAEKRDALVLYARGIALALRLIAADREAFETWARTWFEGMDPGVFETAFENNSQIYFDTPVPRQELFDKNVEFVGIVNEAISAAPLPTSLDFATMVDPSIAQEAVDGL